MNNETMDLLDALSAKLNRHGIRKEFGNSVHEFLGNATPENAPRTCRRAIVAFVGPRPELLDMEFERGLNTDRGILLVVEIVSRTMEATYTVRTHHTYRDGAPRTLASVTIPYFGNESLEPRDSAIIQACVQSGRWFARSR